MRANARTVQRAADALRRRTIVLPNESVIPALADLLDDIAAFAAQPGVPGPQEPVLALCRAILDGGDA